MNKRLRKIQQLANTKLTASTTRGGHIRLTLPNGRFIITANTTRCQRLHNVVRDIRREMGGRHEQ